MIRFAEYLIDEGNCDPLIFEGISIPEVLRVADSIAQLSKDLGPLIKAIDNKTIKSYLTGFKKSCIFISDLLSKVK